MVEAGVPAASALDAALAAITPSGVTTGWRSITASDEAALWPEELAAIERAVPKRRREFATGRVLLRRLLGVDVPIPMLPDRKPALPADVIASLAHDLEYAVAAVSTHAEVAALGIDVEPITPLSPDLARLVLRPDEGAIDAHLAFTLKEAAYKAWSFGGGRILDHHEVRLAAAMGRFSAEIVPEGTRLGGRYALAGDRWIAVVAIRRHATSH